jgi:hypothetical protein
MRWTNYKWPYSILLSLILFSLPIAFSVHSCPKECVCSSHNLGNLFEYISRPKFWRFYLFMICAERHQLTDGDSRASAQ